MTRPSILVAGGYGTVGRHVTAELASAVPARVVIGGRNEREATALANQFADDVIARYLDVTDERSIDVALDGVGLVVNTIPMPDARLLRAAVERGLAYTTTTAIPPIWETARSLGDRAEETGARVVLGAGIEPGMTNVLARSGATRVGAVREISTAIALSIGDEFGPASLEEILDLVRRPYEIPIDGRRRRVSPFEGEAIVAFPEPIGARRSVLFPFSDQFYYPETLGAETVTARFALDPPWLWRILAGAVRRGGAAALTERVVSRRALSEALDLVHRCYAGRDWFGLVVEVIGGDDAVTYTLVDRRQARATGISAAVVARALHEDRIDTPGVWLTEEVVEPEWFFDRLAERGLTYDVREDTVSTGRAAVETKRDRFPRPHGRSRTRFGPTDR